MYITIYLILILTLLTSVVQCQGGGGKGGGGGGGGGHADSSGSGKGSCFTRECTLTEKIITSCAIMGLLGLIIWRLWACYRRYTGGRPSQMNTDFIRENSLENHNYKKDPFETGVWSFRYCQYGKWHGPYRLLTYFDRSLGEMVGEGTDDVGNFTFDGIFSSKNLRLALTQKYKEGTSDPKQNLGHTSTIQLTWNSNNNQFEGKWYVQTKKYSGDDKFELKFEESLVHLLEEKTEC
ncbi:unnamed protein product [Rotaria sordida]|uniref:Uncharacterized protein n=1 Tax=Rotaria sordida TaxID=392033 RepID=A0A814THE9_9BILA|nr:unnamed protein product [Rotaria sordida]CAF1063216.1 unnamed protein product [Rotaria sordida]CAF1161422.1 unnamed protein product [Rotaria sordida]CAF1388694.1 unnamed protein product [Rotaria sordida]CAF3721831.1 unnamed protein product [Rotaria sordida]